VSLIAYVGLELPRHSPYTFLPLSFVTNVPGPRMSPDPFHHSQGYPLITAAGAFRQADAFPDSSLLSDVRCPLLLRSFFLLSLMHSQVPVCRVKTTLENSTPFPPMS